MSGTIDGWPVRVRALFVALICGAAGCGGGQAGDTDGAPGSAVDVAVVDGDEADSPSSAIDALADASHRADGPPGDGDSAAPVGRDDAEGPGATDGATATDDGTPPAAPSPWRSELYPEDWAPGHAAGDGRALHDFSWAGYRSGRPLPAVAPGPTFDAVADFGADPSGAADAAPAIQAAIDAAGARGGGVVHLPAGLYRIDQALRVAHSGVVVRGAGSEQTRLWFTRLEGVDYSAHLRFGDTPSTEREVALAADAPARAVEVAVEDAAGLAAGDDVALGQIITPAFVADHGMTGTWRAFNDRWQPFARRTVTWVDTVSTPHRVGLDVPLRSPLAVRHGATLRREQGWIRGVGLEDVAVADAVSWEAAWESDQVHAVELRGVVDGWVRRVASFPSPGAPDDGDGAGAHLRSGGLLIRHARRVTVADARLGHAQHRGSGGNGYLFEVRQANEILFRDCEGVAGRHNFIQNWGFGASGIVWQRIHSRDGVAVLAPTLPIGPTGLSEFHHSLATANLIEDSVLDDGWGAVNRGDYSTGAGHSATESVFWNVRGGGVLRSLQYGWGYVIGTGPDLALRTDLASPGGDGTAPEDHVEGRGAAAGLRPASLYDDQLARRRGR